MFIGSDRPNIVHIEGAITITTRNKNDIYYYLDIK